MISKERYFTTTAYCSVGKYVSERAPMIHQKRRLSSFVLLYGIKETLFISDNGKEYSLSPNQYLILGADREHAGTKPSAAGLSYYWCHFYINGQYRTFLDADGREFIEFGSGAEFLLPMYGSCSDTSRIHLLFHQLIDSSRASSSHSKFITNGFLDIIFAELSSLRDGKSQSDKGSRMSENITEWIKLNATQLRGVDEIAAHFGYNSEYLTTMIKKATGKSLIDHINENRISRARELLRTSDMTVRNISYECGFSDEKYFSRVFKRYCDMTPTEFRNTYAKQHNNDR